MMHKCVYFIILIVGSCVLYLIEKNGNLITSLIVYIFSVSWIGYSYPRYKKQEDIVCFRYTLSLQNCSEEFYKTFYFFSLITAVSFIFIVFYVV